MCFWKPKFIKYLVEEFLSSGPTVVPGAPGPQPAPSPKGFWDSRTQDQKNELIKDGASILGALSEALNFYIPFMHPGIGLTIAVMIRPILNRFCNQGS